MSGFSLSFSFWGAPRKGFICFELHFPSHRNVFRGKNLHSQKSKIFQVCQWFLGKRLHVCALTPAKWGIIIIISQLFWCKSFQALSINSYFELNGEKSAFLSQWHWKVSVLKLNKKNLHFFFFSVNLLQDQFEFCFWRFHCQILIWW